MGSRLNRAPADARFDAGPQAVKAQDKVKDPFRWARGKVRIGAIEFIALRSLINTLLGRVGSWC